MIEDTQYLESVPLKAVHIEGGFWGDRQTTNRDRTIPSIYEQMKKAGYLDAWRLNWRSTQPKPKYFHFWDSDTGKWIESVGYSLADKPNPELEKQVDEIVDLIERAQQPDGYLNIFFTVYEPQNHWRNLRDMHELYDAGHLMEGAVSYYQATGKRKLLDILCRYADHIDSTLGPGEGHKHGYCGHPEVELALVKLYQATGEKRYLNLSKYFIDERGKKPHYFDLEARERGEDPRQYWAKTYRYCQADIPVREQTTVMGHAVRACYLYSGMADIAAQTHDAALLNSCRSIWEDLTQTQMYITGGLGPAHSNEGFTFAYDLPNEEAYAETCASIALVLWARRMFNLDPDSRYTNVMERALYNGILSGVSFDGSTFFYANPLAAYPNINPYPSSSGVLTDGYYRRSKWFDCACCPPNLARMVANVGHYMYSVSPDTLYVHLYNQNRAQVDFHGTAVQIEQQTNYPWEGDVHLTLKLDQPTQFTLALRIPDWSRDFHLELNGSAVAANPAKGYVSISRQWANMDEVVLRLSMPIERMVAHPSARQDAGYVALQRGPVVYCFEQVDNGDRLANLVLPREARLEATVEPSLFGGVTTIKADAMRAEPANWPQTALYSAESRLEYKPTLAPVKAIPYAFWANRDPGEMRVWIRES